MMKGLTTNMYTRVPVRIRSYVLYLLALSIVTPVIRFVMSIFGILTRNPLHFSSELMLRQGKLVCLQFCSTINTL